MNLWKRILSVCLIFSIISSFILIYSVADTDTAPYDMTHPDNSSAASLQDVDLQLSSLSALLMEAETGTVLYENNADEELPPASVTKIMTLLLVMEAIDGGTLSLSDPVTVSAYAASMGGSQVFLEEGETMTVEDLLKCTVIASANDAAVALAEHLQGSEAAFVARMNERAKELGLSDACFENVTGLDDDTVHHVMSARDVAVISRELIQHKTILKYSSVWMDTIRDGAFTLTNTNRLIRFYRGATGLKTGSTAKAKFCITATAERNGMTLIAVVMGAPSRDERNNDAKAMFDWGFANFTLYRDPATVCDQVPVLRGNEDSVEAKTDGFSCVLSKNDAKSLTRSVSLESSLTAPVNAGDQIGTVTYTVSDQVVGTAPVYAGVSVPEIGFFTVIGRMLKIFILS